MSFICSSFNQFSIKSFPIIFLIYYEKVYDFNLKGWKYIEGGLNETIVKVLDFLFETILNTIFAKFHDILFYDQKYLH